MKVYAFLYNSYIYKSAYSNETFHNTRKGAEMKVESYRAEKERKY